MDYCRFGKLGHRTTGIYVSGPREQNRVHCFIGGSAQDYSGSRHAISIRALFSDVSEGAAEVRFFMNRYLSYCSGLFYFQKQACVRVVQV